MSSGKLFVVGTPIGNLDDLTIRAAAVLSSVSFVACEDTRRTSRLINAVFESFATGSAAQALKPKFVVANEHTEASAAERILTLLEAGEQVALVTDAGMPAISDPGAKVVSVAAANGFVAEVIPGPCAVSAALAVSGFEGQRYIFEGFLPRKGRKRTACLEALAKREITSVIYESPHRVRRTLADLAQICAGERRLVVARELTKLHEEVLHLTVESAEKFFAETEPRGEFVFVLDGAVQLEIGDADIVAELRKGLQQGLSIRDCVDATVLATGVSRKKVYDLAVGLRTKSAP